MRFHVLLFFLMEYIIIAFKINQNINDDLRRIKCIEMHFLMRLEELRFGHIFWQLMYHNIIIK